MKKWSDNCVPSEIINYFVEVERICDEVFDEQTTNMSMETFIELCSVDIETELALSEPGRIAPRVDVSPFLNIKRYVSRKNNSDML